MREATRCRGRAHSNLCMYSRRHMMLVVKATVDMKRKAENRAEFVLLQTNPRIGWLLEEFANPFHQTPTCGIWSLIQSLLSCRGYSFRKPVQHKFCVLCIKRKVFYMRCFFHHILPGFTKSNYGNPNYYRNKTPISWKLQLHTAIGRKAMKLYLGGRLCASDLISKCPLFMDYETLPHKTGQDSAHLMSASKIWRVTSSTPWQFCRHFRYRVDT